MARQVVKPYLADPSPSLQITSAPPASPCTMAQGPFSSAPLAAAYCPALSAAPLGRGITGPDLPWPLHLPERGAHADHAVRQDWLALPCRPLSTEARGGLRLTDNFAAAIRREDFANMTSLVHLTLSRNTIGQVAAAQHCGPTRPPRPAPRQQPAGRGPGDQLRGLGNLRHLILGNNPDPRVGRLLSTPSCPPWRTWICPTTTWRLCPGRLWARWWEP